MKKIIAFLFTAFVLAACGNDSANENSGSDTTSNTVAPDNTINSDTMGRSGDTSSYERMPQRKSDTIPQ